MDDFQGKHSKLFQYQVDQQKAPDLVSVGPSEEAIELKEEIDGLIARGIEADTIIIPVTADGLPIANHRLTQEDLGSNAPEFNVITDETQQQEAAQAESDRIDAEQDEQMHAEEHPENDDAYHEANTPATF